MSERISQLRNRARRESGAALLISMMLLAAMALIGFASLNTVMRDREVVGYSNQGQSALFGADAALAASLDVIRLNIVGVAITAGECLTSGVPSGTMPNGVSYGPDSTASGNICMLGAMEPCTEVDSSIEQGQPIYMYTLWNLRTQGTAPTGATARIQATAERCHAMTH